MSYDSTRGCNQCGQPSPRTAICGECEIDNRNAVIIEQLTEERDEARRIVRGVHSFVLRLPDEVRVAYKDIIRLLGNKPWTWGEEMLTRKKKKATSPAVAAATSKTQEQERVSNLERKLLIEYFIGEAYVHQGIRLFWSKSLSEDENFGGIEEVEGALSTLIWEGRLYTVFCIHGPEGHLCWQGGQNELGALMASGRFRCNECGFEVDPLGDLSPPHTRVEEECGLFSSHYCISDAWAAVLAKRRTGA